MSAESWKHWTHCLCCNVQKLFGLIKTFFQSEALHSQSMLEHAKVIWLIRIFFLSNQRYCTHKLCWNMQRSFDWSEYSFWEIRGIPLTFYVGTCKGHLTDQNILSEKSETLHSQTMLEHAKVIWLIRTFLLNIALTCYVGTCKGHLTDQNILPEQSEALHSLPMLEHAKVIWLIRTSLLSNHRHCTHILCWNMQRSFDWLEMQLIITQRTLTGWTTSAYTFRLRNL